MDFSSKEQIFKIIILLPDGKTKEFKTDEYNESITLKKFEEKYGRENIQIRKIPVHDFGGLIY
jgi:hypothetical protein